jgi:uncharacterized protein (UPF0335 family)
MSAWRTKKAAAPAKAADDGAPAVGKKPAEDAAIAPAPPSSTDASNVDAAAALAAAEAALAADSSPGTPDAPVSPRPGPASTAVATEEVEVEEIGGGGEEADDAASDDDGYLVPSDDGTLPADHARALAVTAASLAIASGAVGAPPTPTAGTALDEPERLLAANRALAERNTDLLTKLDDYEARALRDAARLEVEPADLEELTARSERLVDENRSLATARAALETRVARVPILESEISRLRDEVSTLFRENHGLRGEVDKLNQVASFVGARVAKVLAGARKANAYNATVAAELKRWNRKLEAENARLYAVIDRLQAARDSGEPLALGWGADGGDTAVALLRDDGNALMTRLEEQNRTLAREISSLSADAVNLQELSSAVADASAAGPGGRGRDKARGAVSHPVPVAELADDPRERARDEALAGARSLLDSLATRGSASMAAAADRESAVAATAEAAAAAAKAAELDAANQRLAAEIESASAERSAAIGAAAAQVTNLETMRGDLAVALARVEALTAENGEQADELAALRESVVTLRREAVLARELRDEVGRLEDGLEKANERVAALEADLADAEEEADRLADAGDAANAKAAAAAAAAADAATTRQLLETARAEVEAARTRLGATEFALAGAREEARAAAAQAAAAESLRAELDALRGQTASLSQLKGASSMKDTQLRELRDEVADLRVRASAAASLAAELQDLKARLAEAECTAVEARDEAAAALSSRGEAAAAGERARAAEAEAAALRAKVARLEAGKADAEELRQRLSAAEAGAASAGRAGESARVSRAAEESARARLDALMTENRELGMRAATATAELESLRAAGFGAAAPPADGDAALAAARAELATVALRAESLATDKEALRKQLADATRLAATTGGAPSASVASDLRGQAAAHADEVRVLREKLDESRKAAVAAAAAVRVPAAAGAAAAVKREAARAADAEARAAALAAEVATLRDAAARSGDASATESLLMGLRSDAASLAAEKAGLQAALDAARAECAKLRATAAAPAAPATPAKPTTAVAAAVASARAGVRAAAVDVSDDDAASTATATTATTDAGDAAAALAAKSSVWTRLRSLRKPAARRGAPAGLDDISAGVPAIVAKQVATAYEIHAPTDVGGFMEALGFTEFRGPTPRGKVRTTFDDALHATRRGACPAWSAWDEQLAAATHALLQEWSNAHAASGTPRA